MELLIFFLLLILRPPLPVHSASSYPDLVYRGCSKQALSDPSGIYAQSISTLYSSLIQQSAKSKFYKAAAGAGASAVTGLFQCRGDLTAGQCYACVAKIPPIADQLCGKVTSARVQLQGCYLLYEVSGFAQISGLQALFKLCSRDDASGSGFDMKRDTAFTVMQSGVASGGNGGYFATTYQQVYALGQCEGDLSSADCAQCVKSAVQTSQVECGNSISGQVYLNKCFISYSYYPNGVPSRSSSYYSPSSSSSSSSSSPSGTGQNTGKTVAIILGGTAGVGFLIICVLFARGLKKKDDDY